MNIEDIILKYVFIALEILLLHIFFNKTTKTYKYNNSIKDLSGIFINIVLALFISNLVSNNLLRITFTTIISYLTLISLYKNIISKEKILLYFTMYIILLVVCDFISISIMGMQYEKYFSGFEERNYIIKIITSCLSKVLLIFILKYMINLIVKRRLIIIPQYNYIVIIILSFTIVITISLAELFINYKDIYLMLIAISLLIINLSVFFMMKILGDYFEKEENRKLIEIKNELLCQNYFEQEKILKETRKLKHDIQNDFTSMYLLLDKEEIDTAKTYIKQKLEKIPITIDLFNTGDNLIDVILNLKSQKAKENNIKFLSRIKIDEKLKLEQVDLSSLLTNLLDNAIEANLKIKDIDKRFIEIRLGRYRGYFMFRVSNACAEDPLSVIEVASTTKDNKEEHGLGMKIIDDIVRRYDGSSKYKYENEVFVITILF